MSKVLGGSREVAASIPGVDDTSRLDKDNVGFAFGDRAVLDTAGYDEELSGPESHVPVPHLDGELAARNEEELVSVLVGVPDELTLELDDLDLIVAVSYTHLDVYKRQHYYGLHHRQVRDIG